MPENQKRQATPEPGQLVYVRNRPAIVRATNISGSNGDTRSAVTVEYLDDQAGSASETLLWELEPTAKSLQQTGWPNIQTQSPDDPGLYAAYSNAIRWTSLQSIRSALDKNHVAPLVSPYSSAVQIEDYQLVPVLRAVAMPQVSLLLADDVGLGKTIQAGLIATELIARRRIQRILVVCPASLQYQWRDELKEKFHLDFTILDANRARAVQQELGSDVNPWLVHPRIITSMDYLRQAVILQNFTAGTQRRQQEIGAARRPWDLLIVDEAHNVAPASISDASDRTRMVRRINELFEHRLFLTATPHNGYTDNFLGLLSLLDPVRFVQKNRMSDLDRTHVNTIMVRRLKSQINKASPFPRFSDRFVQGVPITHSEKETRVFEALRAYRETAQKALAKENKKKSLRGRFIFSLLTKRLLSSPYAFARTWYTHLGKDEVDEKTVEQSLRQLEFQVADDFEKQDREQVAASNVGSWLYRELPSLRRDADQVTHALEALGWTEDATIKGPSGNLKQPDAKFDAFLTHVRTGHKAMKLEALVGPPNKPNANERLLLFTEYRDTQDYLLARLREEGYVAPLLREMYGGMDTGTRDEIKQAFNHPKSPIRLLMATDAASEGLNLQRHCRYVAHYEIPWNPMRLEQRNGRVDRHGQPRDVYVFHYSSKDESDQAFLAFVLNKVHEAREDLGSVGTVIDEAVQSHFWGGHVSQSRLDDHIKQVRAMDPSRTEAGLTATAERDLKDAQQLYEKASDDYQLTPSTVRQVVASFLRLESHEANLEEGAKGYRVTGAKGRLRELLQRHLGDENQAIPSLVFDPQDYVRVEHGRPYYEPVPGTRLLRLGHPVLQAALAYFRRAMWGQEDKIHRWTVQTYKPSLGTGATHAAFDVLITARNQLQEVLHSSVHTIWFQVTRTGLKPLADPPKLDGLATIPANELQDTWDHIRPSLQDAKDATAPLVRQLQDEQTRELKESLKALRTEADTFFREAFTRRLKQLQEDMGESRYERLQRELDEHLERVKQLTLSPALDAQRKQEVERLRHALDEEDRRVWDANQKLVQENLVREQGRLRDHVLPKRFAMAAKVEAAEVGLRVYVPRQGGKA